MILLHTFAALALLAAAGDDPDAGFVPLFPKDGVPEDWSVRAWDDLSRPAPDGVRWTVADGVLRSPGERGTWLVCDKEYGDFILEFEAKLGERGNSGVALRAPLRGDPAFDGMELQLADYRYNTEAKPSELTGGIYRAIAPREQVYRPTEWNRCRIELKSSHLKVTLNDVVIHDTNLSEHAEAVARHDGRAAPPVKDRPRRGHIGFQHLSRDDDPVQIRGARIKVLD